MKFHRRIGGTDIAAIMGLNPWSTQLDVFNKIVHNIRAPSTPAMERGTRTEPVLRIKYVDEVGRELLPHPGIIESQEYDFAAISPDDWSISADSRVITVDYKSASIWTRGKWEDGMPRQYELQLVWAMAIGNKDWSELYVGFGKDSEGEFPICETRLYEIERDLEVEIQVLEYAADWWQRHIVTGIAPAFEPEHPKNQKRKKSWKK